MPQDILGQDIQPGMRVLWAQRGSSGFVDRVPLEVIGITETRVMLQRQGIGRASPVPPASLVVVDALIEKKKGFFPSLFQGMGAS